MIKWILRIKQSILQFLQKGYTYPLSYFPQGGKDVREHLPPGEGWVEGGFATRVFYSTDCMSAPASEITFFRI
jgi:hypothetical protein